MLTGQLPFQGDNRKETMDKILNARIHMPWFFSQEAASLLKGLFKRNQVKRLGHGPDGAKNVRKHAFFASIDWVRILNRQVDPPFKPTFSDASEITHYFDVEFTKKTPRALPASAAAHEIFRGFSFISQTIFEEHEHDLHDPFPKLVSLCPVSASALAQRRQYRKKK